MTINNRIEKIKIHYFGDSRGNHKKFIDKLGISSNTASNWMKDGYSIGRGVINQITDAFPDINANWLLTGEGSMLKDDQSKETTVAESKDGVPYYENIDISGGIVPMFSDSKEIPAFYINYQHFNDCTAYLPVVGDSMYPRYASGEIVAVKQIFNREIIQWGEAYLIIGNEHADNIRTIKLVHPCEKDDAKIILRASNPNFKGDTPIDKDDIIAMYIIKGKITRNQL